MSKYVTLSEETHNKLKELSVKDERSVPNYLRRLIEADYKSVFPSETSAKSSYPQIKPKRASAAVEDEDDIDALLEGLGGVRGEDS